jgi:hypothetical protein
MKHSELSDKLRTLKTRAIEKEGYSYTAGLLDGLLQLLSHDLTTEQRARLARWMDNYMQSYLK